MLDKLAKPIKLCKSLFHLESYDKHVKDIVKNDKEMKEYFTVLG